MSWYFSSDPMFRWLRESTAGRTRGQNDEAGPMPRAGNDRAARSPGASGAKPGATTSKPTATTRTACRADAPMSATARSSICKSAPARSSAGARFRALQDCDRRFRRWRRSDGKSSRPRPRRKVTNLLELLQGRLPRNPGRHYGEGGRPVPIAQRSSSVLPAPTGPTCANTLPRCSTASALGLTRSPNSSLPCVAWMQTN